MRNWPFIRSEISLVLAGKKDRVETRRELSVPKTTWNRWLTMAINHGITVVGDHRHSSYHKLTDAHKISIRYLFRFLRWPSSLGQTQGQSARPRQPVQSHGA